jgi:hypothetical protein
VTPVGCTVMLGAAPVEFELELVLAHPPWSNKDAAKISEAHARERLMKTSRNDGWAKALGDQE